MALPNHLGRLESERKGGGLRINPAHRGGLFLSFVLAKGEAESPLFSVMLFDSGPQPLVGLDAADHCVMRVCPRLTLSKGNST